MVAPTSDPENGDFNLWTFLVSLLQKLVFPGQNQPTAFVQKTDKPSNETLLNELFTLDQDKKEEIINEYINERQIKMA